MNDDPVILSFEDFAEMREAKKIPPTPKKLFMQNVRKPMVEYSMQGEYLNAYESAKEASKTVGLHTTTLHHICSGTHLYSRTKERIFLYRGDDIQKRLDLIQQRKNQAKKPVRMVYEYSLHGKLLCRWDNSVKAAKFHKVNPMLITSCCKGKRLYINKSFFLYKDADVKERVREVKKALYILSQKKPKYREVDEYALNGQFIKAFPSASAASREYGFHVSDITRCCNSWDKYGGFHLTCKGRIFLWVGNSISERLELIQQVNNDKNNKKKK